MKALLIPADPSREVKVIEVNGRDELRQHVGGLPEPTQYDVDALMFVNDTGRIEGQPMNVRATDYIKNESEAARQGRAGQGDPTYGLYGNVVAVGVGQDGQLRDVPDGLVERFGNRELARRFVSEDLRNVADLVDDPALHTHVPVIDVEQVRTQSLDQPPIDQHLDGPDNGWSL